MIKKLIQQSGTLTSSKSPKIPKVLYIKNKQPKSINTLLDEQVPKSLHPV